MAATTAPKISLIANKLRALYPSIELRESEDFSWRPLENTVDYIEGGDYNDLLHEFGHALLNHREYQRDIELIQMESAAWRKAEEIATELGLEVDDDYREQHIETYRDWLHARSTCPNCTETGVEISRHLYHCLACDSNWRVNDARRCQLRRWKVEA